MSDSKTERQLNLLFLLLNTKRPIERESIRTRIPGYFDKSDEAFERMFERDKEDLRSRGIPVQTQLIDVFHEDLIGYSIDRQSWQLPEISLSPNERALLNVAKAAFAHTQLAPALSTAALRLGNDFEIDANIQLDISRQSQMLETILKAISKKKCIDFQYLSKSTEKPSLRVVAAWKIFLSGGSSYLIGFDQDNGEQRVFKLSRILGLVSISEEDSIENPPSDLDVVELVNSWRKHNEITEAVELEVAPNTAGELRLLASTVVSHEDFDYLLFEKYDPNNLVKLIAKNCQYVKVVSPDSLIAQVEAVLEKAMK